MKKQLFLLISLIGFMMLSSCKGTGMIVDYSLWLFNFNSGAATSKIFDPNYAGNILDKITVEYKGETYKAKKFDPTTKALPAFRKGLYYGVKEDTKEYYLVFREFSPADNHHEEVFYINWGDGSRSEVKFDLFLSGKKQPRDVNSYFLIDGKEDKSKIELTYKNYY